MAFVLVAAQSITRQDHGRAVHAGDDVPRDHRAAGRAVITEDAGTHGLEAQPHLLARIDEGHRAAAQPAGRVMELDVVRQRIGVRI